MKADFESEKNIFLNIIEKLEEKINNFQRRDNDHDGTNTPANGESLTRKTSRRIRQERYEPTGRKPGGQPGHQGTIRRVDVDKYVEHTLDECPKW